MGLIKSKPWPKNYYNSDYAFVYFVAHVPFIHSTRDCVIFCSNSILSHLTRSEGGGRKASLPSFLRGWDEADDSVVENKKNNNTAGGTSREYSLRPGSLLTDKVFFNGSAERTTRLTHSPRRKGDLHYL